MDGSGWVWLVQNNKWPLVIEFIYWTCDQDFRGFFFVTKSSSRRLNLSLGAAIRLAKINYYSTYDHSSLCEVH